MLGSLTKQLKMTGDAKQTKIIITQMMTMMLTPHSDSRLGRAYAVCCCDETSLGRSARIFGFYILRVVEKISSTKK